MKCRELALLLALALREAAALVEPLLLREMRELKEALRELLRTLDARVLAEAQTLGKALALAEARSEAEAVRESLRTLTFAEALVLA